MSGRKTKKSFLLSSYAALSVDAAPEVDWDELVNQVIEHRVHEIDAKRSHEENENLSRRLRGQVSRDDAESCAWRLSEALLTTGHITTEAFERLDALVESSRKESGRSSLGYYDQPLPFLAADETRKCTLADEVFLTMFPDSGAGESLAWWLNLYASAYNAEHATEENWAPLANDDWMLTKFVERVIRRWHQLKCLHWGCKQTSDEGDAAEDEDEGEFEEA